MLDRKIFFILISLINFISFSGFSQDKEDITITANILNNTCQAELNSTDVTLPAVDAKTIQNALSGGWAAGLTEFSLGLINCGAGVKRVKVKFDGASTVNPGGFLSIKSTNDSAQNVAIKLMDYNKNIISVGASSNDYTLQASQKNTLKFYAEYVALGKVTAGTVNAQASVLLEFD